MKHGSPQTIYRRDYREPDYLIESTGLRFELGEDATLVHSRLHLRRNHDGTRPLVLDGVDLETVSVSLNGEALSSEAWRIEDESLVLPSAPETFDLEIVTRIRPQENTALEGLYKSGDNFCTQCEAEGFRRITWYLDRPDVMSRFTTTIVADPERYPVLLSNGNPVSDSRLEDGRRCVTWEDPFPKPAYLFALVAGDLVCVEDQFKTASGRSVALRFYVEQGNADKCDHAMASLKNAMRWDEQVFGLEYDLDIYMVVAVSDFNMGAMENKGLNVFNTRYVLARADTATDADYRGIEGVIGHEYFHNWTGNRVTCRDWFQLSLKEGLTVFRDQEFSADMGSRAVKRIGEVRQLRAAQFLEDAGPMSHPVRPDSYMEINNFYTATVYNKGAEVVRMLHTLLGARGFRRGMDCYLGRHDGQAVTCDDFVRAMEEASGRDLEQFRLWYSQAGTPVLRVSMDYDADTQTCVLNVDQSCPATPGQAEKAPMHIPLALALLGPQGEELPASADRGGTDPARVLEVRSAREQFRFDGIPQRPVPSLLRGFSAPVKLEYDYTDADLEFLLAHDGDDFNRWEAGQTLAVRVILGKVSATARLDEAELHRGFVDALGSVLVAPGLDPELKALILTLPSESYVGEFMSTVDVEGIHAARESLLAALGEGLKDDLHAFYTSCAEGSGAMHGAEPVARRALANCALRLLMASGESTGLELCLEQLGRADNMTDAIAALSLLVDRDGPEREDALAQFEVRWRQDSLVMDKWFTVQAMSKRGDTLERVRKLMSHPTFALTNPNKVRALIGAFCAGNVIRFHDPSGEGYAFLADQVLALDNLNPQVASRMIQPLTTWRRYDQERQRRMRVQLERMLATRGLSGDVFEMVSKTLGRSEED